MSRVTRRRTRVLAGGALAVVAGLVAAPAHADTPAPATGATAAPSAPSGDPSVPPGAAATSSPTSDPSAPTGDPTGDPTSSPTTSPTAGPTTSPSPSPSSPTTGPTSPPASPTGPPTGEPATAVSRATSYLLGQLTDGTHVVGPYGPDLGQTSDAALALAAVPSQADALVGVTAYLASQAGGYVNGDPAQGEKVGAAYAGPTGKLALVASATGSDPRSFGGIDLVAQLQGLLVTSGPQAGRFSDDSAFGDYSNPLGQAFDVLALERAGEDAPQPALDYLVASQCADGGFPDAFGATSCVSSADATGLVVQALIAASDADCAAARGLDWLGRNQSADGSFASNAADPTKPAVANVNSTAYAALGLAAGTAVSTTRDAVDYLISVQNADGGLPAEPSASTSSNVFASAQSIPALAGLSLLSVGDAPLAERSPTCTGAGATASPTSSPTASPTGSPTATPTATGSPTATDDPTSTAVPATGQPTATSTTLPTAPASDTPQPADDGLISQNAVPVSGSDGEQLARTGTDVLVPVSVGAGLVVAGLILLFLGRRRGGRHA